ncbi:hypothetical protein MHYP_G00261040 [Metynnis hypsauchen]
MGIGCKENLGMGPRTQLTLEAQWKMYPMRQGYKTWLPEATTAARHARPVQSQSLAHLLQCPTKKTNIMAFSPHLIHLTILVLISHAMLGDAAVRVWGLRANNLPGDGLLNRADAYVKVYCAGVYGGRTDTVRGSANPSWASEFSFLNCKPGSSLLLQVWDDNPVNDKHLGNCSVGVKVESRSFTCTLNKGTLSFTYSAN